MKQHRLIIEVEMDQDSFNTMAGVVCTALYQHISDDEPNHTYLLVEKETKEEVKEEYEPGSESLSQE